MLGGVPLFARRATRRRRGTAGIQHSKDYDSIFVAHLEKGFAMSRTLCSVLPTSFRGQRGFTLIELSIVLVIVGLLLAGILGGFRIYIKQKKFNDTQNHIEEVRTALSEYVRNENPPGADPSEATNPNADPVRFPCPASLTVGERANGYAQEVLACRTMAAGTNAGGVWARTGAGASGGSDVVVIGFVPTATLGIPAKYGYDGYGNRLVYAVTQDLTQNMALMQTGAGRPPGQVGMTHTDSGGSPVTEAVDFMVLSPGQARHGAYTAAGVMVRPCNATASLGDGANCAWQGAGNANFVDERVFSLATTGAGAVEYYDDKITYALGTDNDDRWWGPTQPRTSVDIFNKSNTDNVIIKGTENRSQLIVNHTGDDAVEEAEQGANGVAMVLVAGPEPSLSFEEWTTGQGSAEQSRWITGNPMNGNDHLVFWYSGPNGSGILNRSALELREPSGANEPTAVLLGAINDPYSTTGWGTRLVFAGAQDLNTDLMSIARFNVDADITELRVRIGDNAGAAAGAKRDALVIGGTDFDNGDAWVDLMRVRSDGAVMISGQKDYSGNVNDASNALVFPEAGGHDYFQIFRDAPDADRSGLCGEGQFGCLVFNAVDTNQAPTDADFLFGSTNPQDGFRGNMIIKGNTGFVGLGTNAPRARLHVMSYMYPPGIDRTIVLQASEDAQGDAEKNSAPGINFADSTGGSRAVLGLAGAPGHFSPDSQAGNIVLRTLGEDVRLATSPTPLDEPITRLIVKNNGRVGIGTATPEVKLDVAGGVRPGNEGQATICANGTIRYNTAGFMEFCHAAAWRPFGRYDVAGIYMKGGEGDDNACRYHNPYTGACSCPDGYEPSLFWEYSGWGEAYNDGVAGRKLMVTLWQCVLPTSNILGAQPQRPGDPPGDPPQDTGFCTGGNLGPCSVSTKRVGEIGSCNYASPTGVGISTCTATCSAGGKWTNLKNCFIGFCAPRNFPGACTLSRTRIGQSDSCTYVNRNFGMSRCTATCGPSGNWTNVTDCAL